MSDVRPFRALRPRDDLAARVIAPPYDVLSVEECRALAVDPLSFVHVTRAEVDLEEGADPHGETAYHKARENLEHLRAEGVLVLDEGLSYLLYGLRLGEHHQVGFIATCSVDEYNAGLIHKHELTRPDKEDDRTHHMEVLDAQVGLVFLAYRASAGLAAITQAVTAAAPSWRLTTSDGVEHALWVVPAAYTEAVRRRFAELPALYVCDGHHRCAAASRVAARRGDEASRHFLAGLFPDDQLQILPYNRLVGDLNGHDPVGLLEAISRRFEITPGLPNPTARGGFSMYLAGSWYAVRPRADLLVADDPVARLDVSVLQDHLLAPLLGIDDPRRSQRVQFIGGIRGTEPLVAAVDRTGGVAFSMWPTSLAELFEVADAGQVMPPKSTWFEPKLREGVASRLLGV